MAACTGPLAAEPELSVITGYGRAEAGHRQL